MSEKQAANVFTSIIAKELSLPEQGVSSVLELLSQAATVPFIARYRKEQTGGLDEVEIRNIEERHLYLAEMAERRETIISSIETQEKLTPELKAKILAADNKAALEDLYLPYKPKRRTRAIIAREKGLGDLAELILSQSLEHDVEATAASFVDPEKGVNDIEEALVGACDIVAEAVSENAAVREFLREHMKTRGEFVAQATEKCKEERSKFEQYYDYREKISELKGHRFLALRRGERDGFLRVAVEVDEASAIGKILSIMAIDKASPFSTYMAKAIDDAYRRLLLSSIESDVRVDLKMLADREAIEVFAENAQNLLLSPPLGAEAVIGIDPGMRTGCKCVAIDATGKFLDNITIFPNTGGEADAERKLSAFMTRYPSRAVAIGNGTGGRETERFVRAMVGKLPKEKQVIVVMVSESGASIYSASEVAREEFPELDLTVRGAISIARRLQDPLAELVKLDPKSIGVGQYQHDVFQPLLKRKLGEVVESCVNRVGVEINTASAELLRYVAGIGPRMAKKIVEHRDSNGSFSTRAQLRKVSGLGPKTFEQSAGFIRVRESENPLDRSAVHPERYKLVEKIAKDLGLSLQQLATSVENVAKIDSQRYLSEDVGMMTLNDIIEELQKPGRDPRAKFEAPKFNADVTKIEDLKVGMLLDGVVTNVTNFGAFVDVGVHQDGLVHISALSDSFVRNPADVVSVGQNLRVRVVDVDLPRARIALTCRLDDAVDTSKKTQDQARGRNAKKGKSPQRSEKKGFSNNPFAKLR